MYLYFFITELKRFYKNVTISQTEGNYIIFARCSDLKVVLLGKRWKSSFITASVYFVDINIDSSATHGNSD